LGISFGRCKNDAKAMLTKWGITKPTTAQLKDQSIKLRMSYMILSLCTRQTEQDMESLSRKKKMMYWKCRHMLGTRRLEELIWQ